MADSSNSERRILVKRVFDETVALPPAERTAYLGRTCAGDSALKRDVESLLASSQTIDSSIATTAPLNQPLTAPSSSTRLGSRVGVYEIVAEIGSGGMGDVYRAARADGQFEKEVAIKLVRHGMNLRVVLDRFRMERQILAGLDHPNIARLLDGGTTADGLPYLVMELVAGVPIDSYCDQRRLNIAQRLRLFEKVCAAVQYAHQRLVIHRDIKPNNILVGEDGAPKLLDFGIAKLLDPAASADAVTLQAMTPEYASPEQIRGESITTATDVYSLGVLLYQLLTGRSPYASDTRSPHGLANAICEIEPPLPSERVLRTEKFEGRPELSPEALSTPREGSPAKLQRRLAGDLDTIVLKALRKEPERRYHSVEQFADDVVRHLEGQPVIARKDSWSYRAGKFVRRHRVAAAAVSFAGVVLVAGVLVVLRENRVARVNRERAERRFNQVRQLANSFLFDFHDAIQHLPGSTPARELVVKRALEYLDSLAAEAANDPQLQRELAAAYDKVANVQGAPYRSNLGNYPGALASYRKAIAIREQLAQSSSEEKLHTEIGRDYGEVGDLLKVTGDLDGSIKSYEKALAILRALPNPGPETEREIALVQVRYGTALIDTGELTKAVENHQAALAMTDKLLAANPTDRELLRDRAIQTMRLGDVYRAMNRLPDSLAEQKNAVAQFEALAVKTNGQSMRDLAVGYDHLAMAMQKMGDKRGALETALKAVAGDEEAYKQDPNNALARRDVYVGRSRIAIMQSDVGDTKEALANMRQALALCEADAALNPDSTEIRSDLGIFHFRLAEMLQKLGRNREALGHLEKTLQMEEALSAASPKDMNLAGNVAEDWKEVSDLHMSLGDTAAALAGYQKSAEMWGKLVAANPEDVDGQNQLALALQKLGAYYGKQANTTSASTRSRMRQEARNWYQKSLEKWQKLEQAKTLDPEYSKNPETVRRELAALAASLAEEP